MQKRLFRCRKHPFIRAERLEYLIWSEVKQVIQNPDVIVAGIGALDAQGDIGLAEEIARAERDLREVQWEEDRAIRLFVSGKISENQLDQQRKFITERLNHCRTRLDDYRARQSVGAEKRALAEKVSDWVGTVGSRLEGLDPEQRREALRLIVDGVMIDRDNSVNITLAIGDQELVATGSPSTS